MQAPPACNPPWVTDSLFLCTYCGHRLPDEQRSVEHPLGQSIGGTGWSTQDVCGSCNTKAGKEVDQPFAAQPMIAAYRHIHEVPDPRDGQVPAAPRLYGELESGGRAYIELGRDGLSTHRVPHRQKHSDTGLQYVTQLGESEALIRKLEARLRKKHGDKIKIEASTKTIRDETIAHIPFLSLKTTTWPRFGAKLGLAFGREILGEQWLSTADAAHLREILWGRETESPTLDPLWDTVHDDVFTRLAPTPSHLVAAHASVDGTVLIVQLFGKMRYGFPITTTPQTPERWAMWVFDPVQGSAEETDMEGLIVQSLQRGDWGAPLGEASR